MTSTKHLVAAIAAILSLATLPAFAQKQAFYASKIIKNCDYAPAMNKTLISAFLEQELFILRILISIDDQVCGQTADFLAHHAKPSRKTSETYIRQQYLTHQELLREAESQD